MEAEDILAAVHPVPAYNRIPTLLFNALAATEGQGCSVQCGATAFVYKPSNLEAFVTAVSTLGRHWNEVGDGQDSVTKESRQ